MIVPKVNQRNAVEKEIRIEARPETVFQYFVDPDKMLKWKGVEATLDPRPGGVYRVDMNRRDVASGRYVELDPPRRVVFTWGWEGSHVPPGSTTVEVTLTPDGDATIVKLRHLDLPDEEQQKLHAEGWDHYLGRLAAATAGQDPGPDPWAAPE